jgi:TonB family protein
VEWKKREGRVVDGRFHLRRYVGGSAHSAVFLTEFGPELQPAAVKLIFADSAAAHVWLLRRELAARLSHPGLVRLYHTGMCRLDSTDLVYAVMERTEEDLAQVIPIRALTPEETREMLSSVIGTLDYLHREGFVHGCLTLSNVMACGDGIKISSDALLRIGETRSDSTARNWTGPPESAERLTPASDVWSLGMLMVEALTQRAPDWERGSAADPVIPDTLEAPFAAIARQCLRVDPELRPSLDAIKKAMQPGAPPLTPKVKTAAAASQPVAERMKVQRSYLGLAAVVMLLCVLIVVGKVNNAEPHNPRAAEPEVPVAAAPAAPEAPIKAPEMPQLEFKPSDNIRKLPSAPDPDQAPQTAPAKPAVEAPAPKPVEAAAAVPAPAVAVRAGSSPDRPVPDVPPQILRTIRGKVQVKVEVTVDRSGAVVDAKTESRGSRYFGKLAEDAVRRWKFPPAQNADTTRKVRFEFRRDGCEVFAD